MNQLQTNAYIKPELEIGFTPQDVVDWIQWLFLHEKSENTIVGYKYALKDYMILYGSTISKGRMLNYKKYLGENKSPKTVNLRLVGVNSFISYLAELHGNPKIYEFKTKGSKIHKRTSVENVITTEEFNTLLEYCKNTTYVGSKGSEKRGLLENEKWYYIIKTLGYTGVRVSELVKLQADDLTKYGYFKINGKGDKYRNVLIPEAFKQELLTYINKNDIKGFLFTNANQNGGTQYTTRGVSHQIRVIGKNAGVNVDHCHPHSFRHMFALNLLEATNKDISFVSDMLGHSSVNVTAIYLKMSLDKQKNIINDKVNW